MSDNELIVTRSEYIRLATAEADYRNLCIDREREREAYDVLIGRRMNLGDVLFTGIIRTLDGFECAVTEKTIETHGVAYHGGPRRILMVEQSPKKHGLMPDDPKLLVRRIRTYEETDERIKGVKVWQEIRPDSQ